MTEPVARAVSPRRAVRVAVALVAGQAALCAVIGWVTFGPSEAAKPDAAGTHPLTKPIVFPTMPPLPLKSASGVSAPGEAEEASSPRASRSSRSATTRATSKPAAEKPQLNIAPPGQADPQPPALSPGVALTPQSSSPAPVQSAAVEDRPCDPEGAEGVTSAGVELRCVKDADGDLVWQIN